LKRLFHGLVRNRVKPYYLYQADPVVGTGHLRTSIRRGLEIVSKLRGFTSGYAVPTYVVDAPGGGGKVPLQPETIVASEDGRWTIRNWEGETFSYVDPPAEA
jgi:lysine 2,3-aminomutase